MRRFLSFMCFVILLATVPGFIRGDTCFTCGKQEIAVPSYVYPCSGNAGCAWDVFKAGASIVIINPNSGPGTAAISDYVNLVTSVKQSSTVTTVLGYVSTSYGIRSTSQVLSDIDAYDQFYPKIDGIFLDEGSTNCDNTNLTNYKSYDARVKSKDSLGFTVLNWGVVGSECYLINTKIDTYCTFEGNYNTYMSAAANRPVWVSKYDPSAFWNIVHSAPNVKTSVQAAVSLAKTRRAGYFYITGAIYNIPADNPQHGRLKRLVQTIVFEDQLNYLLPPAPSSSKGRVIDYKMMFVVLVMVVTIMSVSTWNEKLSIQHSLCTIFFNGN